MSQQEFEWFQMSTDMEASIQDPLAISDSAFTASIEDYQDRLEYPPLPKYLYAMVRLAFGYTGEEIDGLHASSEQARQLIFWGRIVSALLFSSSVLLIYFVTRKMAGNLAGLISILFLGTNAILLVSLRQVSADPLLIFLLVLYLYALVEGDREPLAHGIILGLIISTEVFWIVLAPVSIILLIWQRQDEHRNLPAAAFRIVTFTATLIITFLLLNPLYWQHPALVIPEVWEAAIPAIPEIPGRTGLAIQIGEAVQAIFIQEPDLAFSQYQSELTSAGQIYLSNPAHNLFRGLIGGSVIFLLSALGVGVMLVRGFNFKQRERIILMAASILIVLVSYLTNPTSSQNSFLPVIIVISIWLGAGIGYPLEDLEESTNNP